MTLPLGIIFFGLLALVLTVDGLKCVQCDDCSSSWPPPRECADKDDLCVKEVVKALFGKVYRRCINQFMKSFDMHCDDPKRGAKTCSYICETDGCNGSPDGTSRPEQWMIFSGIILLLVNNYNG